jgi:hypothetical protein
MGIEALVIVLFLARVQHRRVQDAIERYLHGITEQVGKVQADTPQDEKALSGPSP